MSSRVKEALANHGKGYNCCQAVACAYADLADADENLIFAAGEGFGAGMGGMQCTCGAVSGACMVTGLLKSSRNTREPVTKGGTYRITREIVRAFEEKNGSVICKELKGIETGKVLRSCDGCIEDAARILEQVMGLTDTNE
ncbi:MAG: C_GCAxxG_C_C family protein [Lachnospiraceae bacterium]|jgi:C_GCAxxG_C_C family probable redox protein|nr:C_GCAxxG_C_C family protein [Lachnospiraceae bacterium]